MHTLWYTSLWVDASKFIKNKREWINLFDYSNSSKWTQAGKQSRSTRKPSVMTGYVRCAIIITTLSECNVIQF